MTPERHKRFIAVGEYLENEGVSQVAVIDLKNSNGYKRLRELSIPGLEYKYNSLAFSQDSKLLACVSGGKSIVWDWYKKKLIGEEDLGASITKISINPEDSHLISTSGPNHWKTWRVEERMFKEQVLFSKLSQTQNFTDHCWLDENTIVAVTDIAEVFLAKSNQIIQYIEFALGKEAQNHLGAAGITCVVGFSKGFVLGSDEGYIAVWEMNDTNDMEDSEEEFYYLRRFWHCGRNSSIVSLEISTNEENLAVALSNNDIGYCSLSKAIIEGGSELKVFCGGFHSGKVRHMDLAVQKPLLATCSDEDSTLRIWNYTSMTCELAKKLYIIEKEGLDPRTEPVTKPLQSLAFHPSGFYLAIGFMDKLRLFHLLSDELRFFREVSASRCTLLKFSNEGHMLAAVSGQNIMIYQSYTLEFLQVVCAHTSVIQEISWSRLDQKLYSVGADGAIFEYQTNTWTKEQKYLNNNIEFSCLTLGEDEFLYAAGLEGSFPVIIQSEYENKKFEVDRELSDLLFFKTKRRVRCCFGATSKGSVLNFGQEFGSQWHQEIELHQGPISIIKAAPNGRHLITAGEDGMLFVFKIEESLEFVSFERNENKEKEISAVADESLAEMVLVERKQVSAYKERINYQKRQLEQINREFNRKTKLQDAIYEEKLQEIRDSIYQNIRSQKKRIEELRVQKFKQEEDYQKKLREIEKEHNEEVDKLEDLYGKKLELENERYRQLEHDRVEMKQQFENQIKQIRSQNENNVGGLEEAFRDSLCKAQREYESTNRTAEELKEIYEKRLSQQEDEHEAEVLDINEKYKEILDSITAQHKQLSETFQELKNTQTNANKEKHQLKQKLEKKRETASKIRADISELRKEIKNSEQNIHEKEERISKKENKLYEYKKQIYELKKAKKNLMDLQTEIIEEMQPKDEQIEMLGGRIKNVSSDLSNVRKDNQELQRDVEKSEDLIKIAKNENKSQVSQTEKVDQVIRSIINDIHNAVSTLEPKKWPEEIKKLYHNYVDKAGESSNKDPDSVQELEHQLKYMEKNISGIRDVKKKSQKRFAVEMRKRTQENSTLIQEINKLKFENKNYEIRIKQLKQQIEHLQGSFKETKPQPSKQSAPRQTNPTPFMGYVNKLSAVDYRASSLQDKQRILDLQNDLQEKKEQNFYLRMEINQLKSMIAKVSPK